MSHSPQSAKLNLSSARSYPPCIFNTQAEKDLYKRLRDVYEEHCDTWDAAARDAWPGIVEHASLAPSTIGKITNHYITRHMQNTGVTWAHVVALRIMYEKQLYKSRKLMGLIRNKYPNASFETFTYSEDYTLTFKSEMARQTEEQAVPNTPAVDDSIQRRQNDEDVQLTGAFADNRHREMSKGAFEFLSDGDSSDDEPLMWHSSKRAKQPPNQSSRPKKRATASQAQNEGGVEPHRCTKKPRHAARDTTDASPRSEEAKERTSEEQADSIDVFDKFMSAIRENTEATKENTRATEKHTKAIEENTKVIREMKARSKAVTKKASKD
ncbi:hypothetical protein HDV63DRAFT_242052 [Trichoderma sp. SZMC 28014]